MALSENTQCDEQYYLQSVSWVCSIPLQRNVLGGPIKASRMGKIQTSANLIDKENCQQKLCCFKTQINVK